MKQTTGSPDDTQLSSLAEQDLANYPTRKVTSLVREDVTNIPDKKPLLDALSETRKHRLIHVADVPTTKMRLDLHLEKEASDKHPITEVSDEHPTTESLPEPTVDTNKTFWQNWYPAVKKILPVYISIHVALLAMDCLAFLFNKTDFSPTIMPVSILWEQWNRWDTAHYTHIATRGYYNLVSMAFFPLYPLLERAVMFATGSPFTAGLIISNVAGLIMFIVLYRLVEKDFGDNRAFYTVFYLAIFPTAFFFSAAYSESLFLCLSTLTFYQLRQGRWWLAGLFGFLATCTRPDGLYLLIPFCYEYLCRIWERQGKPVLTIKKCFHLLTGLRFSVLLGLCMPVGITVMMGIGYYRFHDFLAFVHSHKAWDRYFHIPGWGVVKALRVMFSSGFLSFLTLRTSLDLLADTFVGVLLLLSFIGPWKLPRRLWAYNIYATFLFVYFQAFPRATNTPLESMSRFLLELFPAFIVLAGMSKNRMVNLAYMLLSTALLFFLTTQFLAGHWVL